MHELRFGGGLSSATTKAPLIAETIPPTSTREFQTIGVTWTGHADTVTVGVRTKSATGWTKWTTLDSDAGEDDTAPDARGGTDPLYVGPSTGVQARVASRKGALPKDIRVELVDPGTSDYDVTAASTTPGASADLTAAATGGVPEPAVLSRAQWGADESKVRNAPTYMPTIKAAVLHHTAGPNNYPASAVPAIIRGDYAYHLKRGWSDIGYNALVDRFGRIWEGRAGGLSLAVMGAHAGGFNTDTFGVSVIGNYDTARPTAASVAAVERIMAWKLDLNHRDPLGTTRLTSAGGGTARYRAGRTVTFPVVMGHRNTGFTACPGKYLYPYLPAIRRSVKAIMKVALINPSGPPATVLRGKPVTMTARALVNQRWHLDVEAPCGGGRVAETSGQTAAGQVITATWDGLAANRVAARPGRYTLTLTSSSGSPARPVVRSVLVVPPAPAPEPVAASISGAGGYHPVTPTTVYDSHTSVGIGPAGRVDVPMLGHAGIPATGVTAVVLTLTASCESDDTAVSVWPTGTPSNRPVTGLRAGVARSVLVTSRVGVQGSVSIGNATGVSELRASVVGYYGTGGSPVVPIASTRVYNSRADAAGRLVPLTPRVVALPSTIGGVPVAQIKALMVDVSALSPGAVGELSAGGAPVVSYRAGEATDDLAVVPVSRGTVTLQSTTPLDAVLDVSAVVLTSPTAAGATFSATTPLLIVDTRTAGGAIVAGAPRSVKVTGPGTGVPSSATAVLVALTAIAPARATSLQVYPAGSAPTLGAALRAPQGEVRGNEVVVPVGSDGSIVVANGTGAAQVRLDTHGWFR